MEVSGAKDDGARAVETERGVSKKIWAWTADCSTSWQQEIEQDRILFESWPSPPQSIGASSLVCEPFCAGG